MGIPTPSQVSSSDMLLNFGSNPSPTQSQLKSWTTFIADPNGVLVGLLGYSGVKALCHVIKEALLISLHAAMLGLCWVKKAFFLTLMYAITALMNIHNWFHPSMQTRSQSCSCVKIFAWLPSGVLQRVVLCYIHACSFKRNWRSEMTSFPHDYYVSIVT